MDEKRQLLRHVLATLAYRATRSLEETPAEFGNYEDCGRRPVQILAHMGDLMDWALSMAEGNQRWQPNDPLPWAAEQQRFFTALEKLDKYFASDAPLHAPLERLLQGPIADALTHVGQLAMMRRMAGCAAHGENFYVADIAVGQVSSLQPKPVKPF